MQEICEYGESERSCASREYPKCGDNRCTLSKRPELENYLKNINK